MPEDDSSIAGTDTTKKNQGLLPVPSRSSSRKLQPSPTSTGLSGVTASDPTGSIGGQSRTSNTSILGKKRNASVASSKRSATGREGSTDNSGEANARASQPVQMPKTKKSRGFLSFLNCCGVPDNANEVDPEEAPLPAKQVTAAASQPRPTTSSTPATTESKSTQKQSESDKSAMKVEHAQSGTSEKNGEAVDAPVEVQSEKAAATAKQTEETIARTQPSNPHNNEKPAIAVETHSSSNPAVVVEAPTPVILPNSNGAESAPPLPDSSEKDLPDAENEKAVLPHAPEVQDQDTEMGGTQVTYTALPLPPPPNNTDTQSGSSAPAQDVAVQDAHEEKQQWLLPPIEPRFKGKKCLVLDLDETLVHSSFKILHQADFTIPVEIEGQYHNVYVIKRPGVDQFMKRVGELYEVVVFTASVSKYGDPLLDQLDIHNVVHHRLFRESCYNHQGNYVKDLSQVGRDLRETIIIDNSPTSYIFHPQHAVPISSWFSDAHDNELLDLIPVLEDLAGSQVRDVSLVLDVTL